MLDDDQGENGDIRADDAAAHRLALALTGAAGAVAGVAVGEEKADTVGEEDALLHGETLLVVAASDAEDISLPFITNRVGGNLLGNALVEEDSIPALLIEVNSLLLACGGIGDVELHAEAICELRITCRQAGIATWAVNGLLVTVDGDVQALEVDGKDAVSFETLQVR